VNLDLSTLEFDASPLCAARLDALDPLRHFRDRFALPPDTTYLCGNCLGPPARAAEGYVQEVLASWSRKGFRAHFTSPENWLSYEAQHLTAFMAAIVGAEPHETTLMNSLSVNLHLLLVSFYRPEGRRRLILVEDGAFPSDQFVIDSHLRLRGLESETTLLRLERAPDTGLLDEAELQRVLEARGDEIALVLLGNTCFRTGQVLDIAAICAAAHEQGCMVAFDLAHAVGNVELELHRWGVDFAVWCTYKYLNGGPGSLGGCFVHERHGREVPLQRLEGWWGNEPSSRFPGALRATFRPAEGAAAWQLSSPPIVAMAALRPSLGIFADAGMSAIRRKSLLLGAYGISLIDTWLPGLCRVLTPREPSRRGCQLTVAVKADPRELQTWLIERGVVCDAFGVDKIRIAPAPLYNTFSDVHRFVTRLAEYFGRTADSSTARTASAPSPMPQRAKPLSPFSNTHKE